MRSRNPIEYVASWRERTWCVKIMPCFNLKNFWVSSMFNVHNVSYHFALELNLAAAAAAVSSRWCFLTQSVEQ